MQVAEFLDTLSVRSLSRAESHEIFQGVVLGRYSDVEVAALLAALKTRGETIEELTGAAQALRDTALPFPRPSYRYADTCGTGGDGSRSLNISTAAAFVAAEMGIPIAKHGNRSVSSRSGSADVLEALGVRLDPAPDVARRCLDEAGVCFLFAPQYHPGVRHAMPVRRTLGTRTLFNLLGPLANPARPAWQVMGVYDARWCEPLARTLGLLGCERALVVHGSGLDELALHGPTHAVEWRDGALREHTILAGDAGVAAAPITALRGGGPEENAAWLLETLEGRRTGPPADAIALNVAALAWLVGHSPTLADGVREAHEALASGRPAERLRLLVRLSHGA